MPYNPAISLLGINPEKIKTLIWKDTHTQMFIVVVLTIAKMTSKQPQFSSTNKWIKNIWCTHQIYMCIYTHIYVYVYTYICTHTVEYYSAIKKEWNNVICSNMGGLRDYHTKWSQTEKDKYIILPTCGILKKMIQMNLFEKWKQTHRKQIYGYQRDRAEG